MNSGNPTLNDKMFRPVGFEGTSHMTESGAYNKTAILLLIAFATASYTYANQLTGLMMIGAIGGFIVALATIFKQNWSPVTAPIYAALEGLFLGGISFVYQAQYPGIVTNAIMLTFAVMLLMFFVFRYEIIKVTDKFRTIIMVSTGAIALVYLVSIIMSFFGASIPMIHSNGPIGIGFSLVVVGIASFNLLLDFDFIQRAGRSGQLPKYMEWYGAFALMVTLVWLYLEILRLLSKLQSRR
jgi:uncharacterized YccA/Bax inhibitor family protein